MMITCVLSVEIISDDLKLSRFKLKFFSFTGKLLICHCICQPLKLIRGSFYFGNQGRSILRKTRLKSFITRSSVTKDRWQKIELTVRTCQLLNILRTRFKSGRSYHPAFFWYVAILIEKLMGIRRSSWLRGILMETFFPLIVC